MAEDALPQWLVEDVTRPGDSPEPEVSVDGMDMTWLKDDLDTLEGARDSVLDTYGKSVQDTFTKLKAIQGWPQFQAAARQLTQDEYVNLAHYITTSKQRTQLLEQIATARGGVSKREIGFQGQRPKPVQ